MTSILNEFNKKSILIALLWLTLPILSQAANITVGQKLSPIAIQKDGEIVLTGDTISYQAWDSKQLNGKVQVFQYLAARMGIDKINKPFTDALEVEEFPKEKFEVTTLINVDDALWGTSGLISSELKRNKKKHPDAVMVVDIKGAGLKQWALKKKNCAVAVLDKNGKVLFFKEGALDDAEIKANIALIKKNL